MARTLSLFFAVLMVALAAGRAFWVWVGENPSALSMTTYIESFQATIRTITLPITIIGNLGLLSAILAVALSWRDRPSVYFLAMALPLLAASVLITLRINVPINDQIMTWNANAPPEGWMQLRDKWWTWHKIRAVALLAAFVLVLAGTLLRSE
jgi:uncharacterized membrane protein